MSVKPEALLSPRRGCVGERLSLVMTALGEILTKLATEPRSRLGSLGEPCVTFFFFAPGHLWILPLLFPSRGMACSPCRILWVRH